jgi:zinc protease
MQTTAANSARRSRLFSLITCLGLAMTLTAGLSPQALAKDQRATMFKLDNGMDVVVIPDHRAPVVTHMAWYRVGAADEQPGISGIAHFLEHLMFKATENMASGEFSKTIARLGGQDNAFTSQDVTAYFQRVARDRLPTIMKMEAERMTKLRLEEKEVLTERDVIKEERRSRTDNNPTAILSEEMNAALFQSHPYGIPIIGWMHEIGNLSREDALSFYRRHYAPNNSILVVAGDVTPQEVLKLAKETYGKIPRNPDVKQYKRPTEPPAKAARRVELIDARAGQPVFQRFYRAPSYVSAEDREAEALDLLLKVAASGATSKLYRELVVKQKIASSVGGYYAGHGKEYGKIVVNGIPANGVSIEQLESAIDQVIADIKANGITEAELERAKRVYIADYIYGSDNQSSLARRYGFGLVVGRTLKQIEQWPEEIRKVTLAEVKAAADKFFNPKASVTGVLLPKPRKEAAANGKKDRS